MDASPYCVLCEARPRDEWRQLCARKASPRVGPPTKKQCTPPSFAGAATRGEWRQLGARKSFAPGRASHKKQCTPLPLWEPRPAANGASSVPEKASARGRTSHKKKQRCTPPQLWEARPAANGASSVREELRPEVGPPTKSSARRPTLGARALACRLLRKTHDFFAPSRVPAMRACRRSCLYASFQYTRNA